MLFYPANISSCLLHFCLIPHQRTVFLRCNKDTENFGAKFSNPLKGRMYVSATQALPIYYFIVAVIVYFSRHWTNVHIGKPNF